MSDLPTSLPRERILAAFADLGITTDPNDLLRVGFGPRAVTVTEFRRDAEGRLMAAGDDAATVTTVIAITDDEETTR